MKKHFLFLCFCFWQPLANAQPDNVVMLELDGFYSQLLATHPIASQAQLLNETARQELRLARGYFDPKIEIFNSRKQFTGKNYYNMLDAQLKVPLRLLGTDLKFGYEQNTGINLSPEQDTDQGNGLMFAGIMLPLGQGMFTDVRRTVLRQAQIFQDLAEAEKVKIINKLVLEVAKDYWEWFFHYHKYRLSREGYDLALFRFRAVKQRVDQGDMAPIDSVEAKITLQQREINLSLAEVDLQNARTYLSNHLWDENGEPAELAENTVPVPTIEDITDPRDLATLRDYALDNHPELLKLRFKRDQLDAELRLAREMLKPVFNLHYNLLTRRVEGNDDYNGILFRENYKFGFDFVFPIFLRKERAKLQLTNIKIDEIGYERTFLERAIMNDLTAVFNMAATLQEQMGLQREMVLNYQRLLSGETQKFNNGQSSLFLVNVREGSLIEAQIKLYEMQQKYAKSLAELRWAAGLGLE